MINTVKIAIGALAIGASTVAAVAPADAQRYRDRYHHRGGDRTAIAVGAGLIGLGVGAAIASSSRDRYYDRGYYDRGYYGGGYYAPPRYSRYDRGYYGRGHYRPRCYTARVWDPYYGRRIRTRVCD